LLRQSIGFRLGWAPSTERAGVSDPASEEILRQAAEPVREIPGDEFRSPEEGIALCLSGGGYRAMLFHLGALWRLNELGYLPRLARISSVSGGSITGGALAKNWSKLNFDSAGVGQGFAAAVLDPIRQLAGTTIDLWAILLGILLPGSIGDRYVGAFRRHLLGKSTLQDLPDGPRFVVNATNLQSAVLWRFAKPYMRDYRVGEIRSPTLELASAVAASGAFPPFMSPVILKLDNAAYTPGSGQDLQRPPFTTRVFLSDGGVYDNLGLETAWKRYRTILISDGGGHIGGKGQPKRDWLRQSRRVLDVIDSQVRALRKRQAIESYKLGLREGAYWGIRTDIRDYGLANPLPCPHQQTLELARTPTRLKKTPPLLQERLINWGYAVCDAAIRTHLDPSLPAPSGFPYADAGVG
jgi:NTE family protein